MSRLTRALTYLLPVLALVVIVFGAYVRLSDAGLGCPDWPGCYGRFTVPSEQHTPHLEQPAWHARPLESGKAWREMIHRYLASALGLGILLLAFGTWRAHSGTGSAPYVLVPLVIFQGVLGMWTVTLLLKPLVVSAHLLGGLATLSLLWWHLLTTRRGQLRPSTSPALYVGARLVLCIVVTQIFLGGWTSANYAALACTDFPTCHGRWWPAMDFSEAFVLWRGLGINYEFGVLETPARTAIHFSHRLGALVAATAVIAVCAMAWREGERRLRRLASCILAALALQAGLGISNVVGGLPLPAAVLHNAGAAFLLLTLVTLVHFTRRN